MDIAGLHVFEDELFVAAAFLRMEVDHQNAIAHLGGFNRAIDGFPIRRLVVGGLDADDVVRILLDHGDGGIDIHLCNVVLDAFAVHTGTNNIQKCE